MNKRAHVIPSRPDAAEASAAAEYLAAQRGMEQTIAALDADDLEYLERHGVGAGPSRAFVQRAARRELARRAVDEVSGALEPILSRVEKAQKANAELAAQLTAPQAVVSPPPGLADSQTLGRIAESLEKIATPATPGPIAIRKDLDGTVTLLRGDAAAEWLAQKDLPEAPEGSPLARARNATSINIT